MIPFPFIYTLKNKLNSIPSTAEINVNIFQFPSVHNDKHFSCSWICGTRTKLIHGQARDQGCHFGFRVLNLRLWNKCKSIRQWSLNSDLMRCSGHSIAVPVLCLRITDSRQKSGVMQIWSPFSLPIVWPCLTRSFTRSRKTQQSIGCLLVVVLTGLSVSLWDGALAARAQAVCWVGGVSTASRAAGGRGGHRGYFVGTVLSYNATWEDTHIRKGIAYHVLYTML